MTTVILVRSVKGRWGFWRVQSASLSTPWHICTECLPSIHLSDTIVCLSVFSMALLHGASVYQQDQGHGCKRWPLRPVVKYILYQSTLTAVTALAGTCSNTHKLWIQRQWHPLSSIVLDTLLPSSALLLQSYRPKRKHITPTTKETHSPFYCCVHNHSQQNQSDVLLLKTSPHPDHIAGCNIIRPVISTAPSIKSGI